MPGPQKPVNIRNWPAQADDKTRHCQRSMTLGQGEFGGLTVENGRCPMKVASRIDTPGRQGRNSSSDKWRKTG